METCPFCDDQLEDEDAELCPHCGNKLRLAPASEYVESLQFLTEALARLGAGGMTPADAMMLFQRWMGVVQRLLNQANEDLEEQLKIIRAYPAIDTLEVLGRFNAIQDDITHYMGELGEVFQQLKTPFDFEMQLPRIQQYQALLQSRLTDLEQFEAVEFETAGPLPPSVSQSLDHLEKVMENLGHFQDHRDLSVLDAIIEHLDEARALLDGYRREALPSHP